MTKIPVIRKGTSQSQTGLEEIWLETGIDCPLRCSYCFNSAGGKTSETGTLSNSDYDHLLRQAKSMGVNTVGIPGAGEPLSGKNLETTLKILDFCTNNGMNAVIFTNGYDISDKILDRIDKSNVSIMLKYNSSNPEIQDRLVGKRGYTENRTGFIKKLIERGFAKYDSNLTSRLAFVTSIIDANYEELPEIFRYCRDNQIIPDFDTLLKKGRGAKCGIDPEDKKTKAMFGLLQKIDKEEYKLEWPINPLYVAGCCDRYKKHLYIDRFGNISPCLGAHLSGINLGKLPETTLEEAWQTPLMKKIRSRDYEGKCTECGNFKTQKCNSCLGRYCDEISEKRIHTTGCWNKK